MKIVRGMLARIPFAAVGSGPPVVVAAGLAPTTGVDSDQLVRGAIAPITSLATQRHLIVLTRRAGLATGLTMADLAAEYAEALRANLDLPVDVVGTSTGGSIVQQVAADHPDVVGRLVLLSTACRLGPLGRELQSRAARMLRVGRTRQAIALAAGALPPPGLRTLARGIGWTMAHRLLHDPADVADLAATLEAEDDFDLAACQSPIAAKTLIVAGGRDRFYSTDLFRETAALIPDSDLRLFAHRGHVSVLTDPRARATILGFLTADDTG
jgi:pimeloyl-ACP methyl ester carboxylesterase